MNGIDLQQHKMQREVTKDVSEKTQALLDSMNVMGNEAEVQEGFLQGLLKSHPTLVQSFMRSLRGASADIVEKGFYKNDMRAQASRQLFTEIANCEVAIPFI